MPDVRKLWQPGAYRSLLHRNAGGPEPDQPDPPDPNQRGVTGFPPGHFYSPLLDIQALEADPEAFLAADKKLWDEIPLQRESQMELYRALLTETPDPGFAEHPTPENRYYIENAYFCFADAYTLSAMIRHFRPKKMVEVGSGFSSAVMLDTRDQCGLDCALTFIEPYEQRLQELLRPSDHARCRMIEQPVQSVDPAVFEELGADDILFIDSSHVAKVGSDVSVLLLKILPRLQKGVVIHVHDIFYPCSYPPDWLREGRAWNESLFLRAFLMGNPSFQILAFNAYAAHEFPEVFADRLPRFLANSGGSLWLRRIA